MQKSKVVSLSIAFALSVLGTSFLSVREAQAIPVWARKYKTSCATCHYAYPKLNAFGKAFKNNGFRFPGGDENFRKEEPVELGSESYKRVWPDAIWPSDIPGNLPIAIQPVGRINYKPDGAVKSEFEFPHELEVLYGGTLGENASFIGEVELENEDNDTELAFPFTFQWDFNPKWHIQAGTTHPDPTPEHHRLTRNHYNVASFRSRNRWRLRDQHTGLEFWGMNNGVNGRGGYRFQLGVVNGQGTSDKNSSKDVYATFNYKFGGLGQIGGTEGGESQSSAFYEDNNVTLGGFVYHGTASDDAGIDEDFTVGGGTLDLWYDRFILNSTVMYMTSSITDTPDRNSLVWYAQGNYVFYPWLIGLMRFEYTDKNTDDNLDAQSFLIPAITVVLRANVRLTAEYFRPLDDVNKNKDLFDLQLQFGI